VCQFAIHSRCSSGMSAKKDNLRILAASGFNRVLLSMQFGLSFVSGARRSQEAGAKAVAVVFLVLRVLRLFRMCATLWAL
jgi:hypothetical protein